MKSIIGLLLGFAAGIIDLIPMLIQKLPWSANLSALSMWLIIGFFISHTDFKITKSLKRFFFGVFIDTSSNKLNPAIKGATIALLNLIPCAFIIGWSDPESLIPIIFMTTILGSILGYAIEKVTLKFVKNTLK